jgi:hypothetical protein
MLPVCCITQRATSVLVYWLGQTIRRLRLTLFSSLYDPLTLC